MNRKIFLFGFVLVITGSVLSHARDRYTDSLFTAEQTYTDRVFATAPELNTTYTGESATHDTDLKMHIFEPAEDTLSRRPVLICAHGGGFVSGVKEHDDMMAFCQLFAEKGYVTATIQYRLGMNVLSGNSAARAVYRGLQDGRAAIRFLKEKADELRIDTTNVYFLGSSAGAFIGLQVLYMDRESERPPSTYAITTFPVTLDNGPDLGGFDAIESEYRHDGKPKGLISLWGAVGDTLLIEATDATAVLLVHGTADAIVPFEVGSPFGLTSLPATYGSSPIHARLTHFDISHETYFAPGEGHEFYGVSNGNWSPAPNAYWDTVTTCVTQFLYRQHKPAAGFVFEVDGLEARLTDQSRGATHWTWEFGDGTVSAEQNPVHEYAAAGTYCVALKILNTIESWDTLSQQVTVFSPDAVQNPLHEFAPDFALAPNYPNPFNPGTVFNYRLRTEGHVSLKVFDLLGREVCVLIEERQSAGAHRATLSFKGRDLPGGVYVAVLEAGKDKASRKILYLK